ncbi:MAG: YidC/Oxa1 family membrane protein insertase [Vagococcus sp.]
MFVLVLVLTGCGSTSPIDQNSTGVWDRYIVYYFGQAIKGLSFGKPAVGIILFTLVVRVILMPLMHYQTQSMRKTQEIQPKLKALQEKYASKDAETVRKLQEEQQKLYSEQGVNPISGCLPMLVQLPIMMALWQAISRIPELTDGTFMWLKLGTPDPYFILPVLAAIFTFISTKLTSMSQVDVNGTMKTMNFVMPLMILFMGVKLASGLSLYWVVSNAFQVVQTLLINNPFKIKREREAEEQRKRDLEKALRKANQSKKKRK